jgi:hypothetical protein
MGMHEWNDPTPEDMAALERAMHAGTDAEAATRAPLLTGPKRQHFLPKFYLDGFTRDGLVAVFDRELNEVRCQQPLNTAVIGHFYTMTDDQGRKRFELERLLSEYEGKAKPVIDKLTAGGTPTAEERTDLAIFIAFAATRTPDMVNSIQSVNEHFVGHTAKLMFNDVDEVYARLRADDAHKEDSDEHLRREAEGMVDLVMNEQLVVDTDPKWAVQMTVKMALGIAPCLAGRHWDVVHRDSDKQSFITTDSPVFLGTIEPRAPSFYGIGFGSTDAFISFPLNQSCLLQMHGTQEGLRHGTVGRDLVRRANLALGERCQRFVVGRDEALVKSLTQELGLAHKKWQPKIRVG